MTSTVQTFRSTTPTAKPLVNTRQPGELWVNFPDKQLGLIDASQAAQPLIAVRFFSAATSYVSGDIVTQGASLWIAKGSVPAGAFVATQWNQVATYTGGTFASLVLNGPAGTARSLFSQTAGVNRWELQLAGLTSESGSNAGSDFSIYRYNDAGAVIDAPFAITRSTGRATFSLDPFGPSGAYLPLIGGTLTGALTLNADPIADLGAATKQYADTKMPRIGVTDGSNAAAGQIGEVISNVITTVVVLTTGVTAIVGQINLTPGDWDVCGEVWVNVVAASISLCYAAINQAGQASPSAPILGGARTQVNPVVAAGNTQVLSLRTCRVSLTTATTYSLFAQSIFTGGGCNTTGVIWARRAR